VGVKTILNTISKKVGGHVSRVPTQIAPMLTTLERLASRVAVETPIVKPALSSKYMEGKTAFASKTISKTGPNSYGCFHSKAHHEALMRQCFTQ